MSLKIYNSLTNKMEEFIPNQSGIVNMYVCGPTVYNYIHIGNARPVVFFDMLKNYLTFKGYKVNYASNITDVDDKIIKKAIEEGVSEKEIASRYEQAYFKNCEELGAKRPDFVPHATDYIAEMISFINGLMQKGYAYENDGDVYFRVGKMKEYGMLSNQNKDELESGARVDVSTKKESPLDFNLWKKTEKGIKWDSPFGAGRPGWHTECVCMIDKLFGGKMIDIHGGGMDLKFPHHENEIAQSNAYYGHHLAKYWMHVGRLNLGKDGSEKMSKSLGNVVWVNDFKTEEDLMSLRLLIIATPYRNSINYTSELFEQYKKEYQKMVRTYKQAALQLDYNQIEIDCLDEASMKQFEEYMDQDLNTQNVMTLLTQIQKEINVNLRANDLNKLAPKVNSLKKILDILGIILHYNKMTLEDRNDYDAWLAAKKEKNFELADQIRVKLTEKGVL